MLATLKSSLLTEHSSEKKKESKSFPGQRQRDRMSEHRKGHNKGKSFYGRTEESEHERRRKRERAETE